MNQRINLAITEGFLQKLRCVRCNKIGHFKKVEEELTNYTIFCENCGTLYPVRDGILYTISVQTTYWDELHVKGIRGNPIRRSNLVRLISKTLNNLPYSLLYYPLIELLSRSKTNFLESIELGCGTGVFSLLLKKMRVVSTPILVDKSLPALRAAQHIFETFGERALFVLADALDLPFADKSFDLALSAGLIEHFAGENQRKIVSEHCRVATNVVCQVPISTPFYWFQRAVITALNYGWPFGYEVPLSLSRMEYLFRMEGFRLYSHSYHDLVSTLLTRATLPFRSLIALRKKGLVNQLTRTEIVIYFVEEDGKTERTVNRKGNK